MEIVIFRHKKREGHDSLSLLQTTSNFNDRWRTIQKKHWLNKPTLRVNPNLRGNKDSDSEKNNTMAVESSSLFNL